jgi:hypothetical protein
MAAKSGIYARGGRWRRILAGVRVRSLCQEPGLLAKAAPFGVVAALAEASLALPPGP